MKHNVQQGALFSSMLIHPISSFWAQLREEGEPEVIEELITVDAVGCFEGEDDFEEETHEDEDSRVLMDKISQGT